MEEEEEEDEMVDLLKESRVGTRGNELLLCYLHLLLLSSVFCFMILLLPAPCSLLHLLVNEKIKDLHINT